MIEKNENINQYLLDYVNGKIKMGLETGLPELDRVIRYKQGQFNIVNGLDNVGKTVWLMWYFLVLAKKHGLRFIIWSGENKSGQLVRQLIEFNTGQKLKTLGEDETIVQKGEIEKHFMFVDNSKFYTSKELLDIFYSSQCHCALIDPFTGLNREYTHAANYQFLNEVRQFCNKTGMTVYVNTHPVSEAARRTYSNDHKIELFRGYPMPPSKSQSEGGQPFANRPDDFITIHRFVGHPELKYKTMIYVRKVKDTETGGEPTGIDDPIEFEFNRGLGFTCNGINPLSNTVIEGLKPLDINEDFENEDSVPF